jgi:hypothetical protein
VSTPRARRDIDPACPWHGALACLRQARSELYAPAPVSQLQMPLSRFGRTRMWWIVRAGARGLNGTTTMMGAAGDIPAQHRATRAGCATRLGAIVIESSDPSASGVAACAAPTWHIPGRVASATANPCGQARVDGASREIMGGIAPPSYPYKGAYAPITPHCPHPKARTLSLANAGVGAPLSRGSGSMIRRSVLIPSR